jgi:hypothetical protein
MESNKMDCHDTSKNKNQDKKSCCFSSDIDKTVITLNNTEKIFKVLKVEKISILDIFSLDSNHLENRNLVKNISPP